MLCTKAFAMSCSREQSWPTPWRCLPEQLAGHQRYDRAITLGSHQAVTPKASYAPALGIGQLTKRESVSGMFRQAIQTGPTEEEGGNQIPERDFDPVVDMAGAGKGSKWSSTASLTDLGYPQSNQLQLVFPLGPCRIRQKL